MTQKIHIPPTYLKNFCFYMFCYTISIILLFYEKKKKREGKKMAPFSLFYF